MVSDETWKAKERQGWAWSNIQLCLSIRAFCTASKHIRPRLHHKFISITHGKRRRRVNEPGPRQPLLPIGPANTEDLGQETFRLPTAIVVTTLGNLENQCFIRLKKGQMQWAGGKWSAAFKLTRGKRLLLGSDLIAMGKAYCHPDLIAILVQHSNFDRTHHPKYSSLQPLPILPFVLLLLLLELPKLHMSVVTIG
jgi:hypothetical protein